MAIPAPSVIDASWANVSLPHWKNVPMAHVPPMVGAILRLATAFMSLWQTAPYAVNPPKVVSWQTCAWQATVKWEQKSIATIMTHALKTVVAKMGPAFTP